MKIHAKEQTILGHEIVNHCLMYSNLVEQLHNFKYTAETILSNYQKRALKTYRKREKIGILKNVYKPSKQAPDLNLGDNHIFEFREFKTSLVYPNLLEHAIRKQIVTTI